MQRIHARVARCDRIELQELFEPRMHKSALVGLFLATLEMTRYHGLSAVQTESDGPLWLEKGSTFPAELDIVEVEGAGAAAIEHAPIPFRPR
jgi:segregation and condensation protein A